MSRIIPSSRYEVFLLAAERTATELMFSAANDDNDGDYGIGTTNVTTSTSTSTGGAASLSLDLIRRSNGLVMLQIFSYLSLPERYSLRLVDHLWNKDRETLFSYCSRPGLDGGVFSAVDFGPVRASHADDEAVPSFVKLSYKNAGVKVVQKILTKCKGCQRLGDDDRPLFHFRNPQREKQFIHLSKCSICASTWPRHFAYNDGIRAHVDPDFDPDESDSDEDEDEDEDSIGSDGEDDSTSWPEMVNID